MKIALYIVLLFGTITAYAGHSYDCSGKATILSSPKALPKDVASQYDKRTIKIELKVDELDKCGNLPEGEKALGRVPHVANEYTAYLLPLDKNILLKKGDVINFEVSWGCGKNRCYEKSWTQVAKPQ